MRRMFLLGFSALLVVGLGYVPVVSAQCNEVLKAGSTFDFVVASEDKTVTGKGTFKVETNDGTYIELAVTSGNTTGMMPGGIDGNRVIATNPKNGNVWIITCTAKGLEGTSTLAGKAMKVSATKKK